MLSAGLNFPPGGLHLEPPVVFRGDINGDGLEDQVQVSPGSEDIPPKTYINFGQRGGRAPLVVTDNAFFGSGFPVSSNRFRFRVIDPGTEPSRFADQIRLPFFAVRKDCGTESCPTNRFQFGDEILLSAGVYGRVVDFGVDLNAAHQPVTVVAYYVTGHELRPTRPPVSLARIDPVATRPDMIRLGNTLAEQLKPRIQRLVGQIDALRLQQTQLFEVITVPAEGAPTWQDLYQQMETLREEIAQTLANAVKRHTRDGLGAQILTALLADKLQIPGGYDQVMQKLGFGEEIARAEVRAAATSRPHRSDWPIMGGFAPVF